MVELRVVVVDVISKMADVVADASGTAADVEVAAREVLLCV
jgi:hypothetical protein